MIILGISVVVIAGIMLIFGVMKWRQDRLNEASRFLKDRRFEGSSQDPWY